MKWSLLALALFSNVVSVRASELPQCGNSPQFIAQERARAGVPTEQTRGILKSPRSVRSDVTAPPKPAPLYPGSSWLGEPLIRSLLPGYVFSETGFVDTETSRTEEAYINRGYWDEEDPEADQDGWVEVQRGYFDFDFNVYSASLWSDEDWDDFEILVNEDLDKSEAERLITRTLSLMSQMTAGPVAQLEKLVIHPGDDGRATASPFSNIMTIYPNTIDQSDSGFMNTLYHEMAHIAVEELFYESQGWAAAVQADGAYLTEYGETNEGEDFAETWVPWLRLKYYSDYGAPGEVAGIAKQIPNRLAFLDEFFGDQQADDWFQPVSFRNSRYGEKESQASLEEPVDGGVHSGISNIRGWAVSTRGVGRVAVYVDGVYAFEAPLGGARGDVGREFPDAKDSRYSGFGLTYNYGALSPGSHTMTIKAYGLDGSVTESSSTFTVASFHSEFFPADKPVELGSALLNASGDELTIQGAKIDNQNYDLVLKWQVPSQGFKVIAAD